ncbi:hypothetical protein [Natrinema halophilum]|uniref:Uncharacterized protein n=1 Tax=Natrinema halophilum TaxID=1699371 RepID=A0A7D5KSH8_9EURY|nr:hypothetical protein [Natrinema halophilum]QLG49464.1 hypothetical protein HYG82_11620 [Natrinema halophilum]
MTRHHLSDALERFVERIRLGTSRAGALWTSSTGGRLRPTGGGGLLVVLTSAAVSLASAQALGDSVRIRWSVGAYYGPEYAPTPLALAAFPVLIALMYLGLRGLALGLERSVAFDPDYTRGLYELCVLATLIALLVGQLAFVVANLL